MIYIPDYKASTYPCVVVQNATTIRAYKQMPYNPVYNQTITIQYRDFYYNDNAHYYYTDGQQNFNYNSTLPTCLANTELTNDVYYRNDFHSILIMFLILCIFCFVLPLTVMKRFSRRLQ